uniref:OTU domain-containing protein n=1 Tax=Globodera rostochiensis TaxID=31243 RepID=A0A914H180_GLORO
MRLWTVSALSLQLLLLFLLNFPPNVEPHNFSPLMPARHFDERLLRDSPPATIKVVTKNGTKKLELVEEGGKKVWRWVKEGEKKETPSPSPQPQPQQQPQQQQQPQPQPQPQPQQQETPAVAAASPSPKQEAPAGPTFVFDPPTPEEQIEFQDKLLEKQDIDLRVPKDVYLDYHKLVKKSEDNKNVVQSKTLPTKVAEIQRNSDNLYRALAYALAGTEMLHKATRTYVREYFEGFFGHLDKKQAQPWLDEFEVRSVRRQSEKVKDGKTGGLVELVAAAKKLNINILVYKTDKNQWLCMSPKTAHKADLEKKADCQSKDKLTIALELYDDEHFDVILDVEQKK